MNSGTIDFTEAKQQRSEDTFGIKCLGREERLGYHLQDFRLKLEEDMKSSLRLLYGESTIKDELYTTLVIVQSSFDSKSNGHGYIFYPESEVIYRYRIIDNEMTNEPNGSFYLVGKDFDFRSAIEASAIRRGIQVIDRVMMQRTNKHKKGE